MDNVRTMPLFFFFSLLPLGVPRAKNWSAFLIWQKCDDLLLLSGLGTSSENALDCVTPQGCVGSLPGNQTLAEVVKGSKVAVNIVDICANLQ